MWSPRLTLLAGVAAGVAALGLGYALSSGTGPEHSAAARPDTSASAAASPGSAPSGDSTKSSGEKSSDQASGTAGDNTDGSVQVQPEVPGSTETSGLPGLDSKQPDPDEPLVDAPLPETASIRGSLVEGYPRAVLGPAARSRIVSSSVSSSGDALQVALDARHSSFPNAVLRSLRLRLARLGFDESESPAVGGSTAAAFQRGDDTVVVTVRPSGRGTSYTVFGTLHTEA